MSYCCTCGYGPVSGEELDSHRDYMILVMGDDQSEHRITR